MYVLERFSAGNPEPVGINVVPAMGTIRSGQTDPIGFVDQCHDLVPMAADDVTSASVDARGLRRTQPSSQELEVVARVA